jgi:L-2,4-diaminobutyrate decarboxylase
LQVPTLLAAAAAEVAIGVTNQSLDSFDQAPAATLLEDHLVRWLGGLLGLPDSRSGVLTSGGTASNLLGLLLARDHAAPAGWSIAADGLPPDARDWRIVASAAAHFSVQRSAALLGLGHRAVTTVATDRYGRMDVAALDEVLADLARRRLRPIALVGTAGTTDLGAIDPLSALAARARHREAWFHVDAAVGAGLAFSPRLQPRLTGIEAADSVTADLHKLGWQPIGASALLVRDGRRFDVVRHRSDYLDRDDDADRGVLNLVSRSLDTSRRFDALKIVASLRTVGRRRMGTMVEHLVDTTVAAAELIDRSPDLELLAPPSSVTVVFRYRPAAARPIAAEARHDRDDETIDRLNTAVQRELFDSGQAAIGRTRLDGRVALKLTLVNPLITRADVEALLALVVATATDISEAP